MNIYLKTLLITTFLFSAGLVLGLYIERFFVSDLSSRTVDVENSVKEIELEMLYFQGMNESYSCSFLDEIVRKTNNNLDTLANQLLSYSENNILFTRSEIKNIKQTYTYLLIKDWLLQERIKKTCGTKTVTILYFYSTKGCDDCIVQGNILTVLKNDFKEKVMIFPLDVAMDIDMIEILTRNFNITSTPALVIDDDVYLGITGKNRLEEIICPKISDPLCED